MSLPSRVLKDSSGNEILGKVTGSPAASTIGARLKAIETALAALGYEFTINGVNFNGYAKIKSLFLEANAKDDVPKTLHHYNDEGALEDYKVPEDKVFISFQAMIYLEQTTVIGRIGESDTADGAISKEILKFSNGTNLPFITNCYGVFAAEKYITAETDSSNASYEMVSGSVLYGVEVDA